METDQATHEGIRAEGLHAEPGPLSLSQPSSSLPLPAPVFPVGAAPTEEQWTELSTKVKKGEAVLQGGLRQLEASTDVANNVVEEQGQKLKECLLQLDSLISAGRRSTWLKLSDGGYGADSMEAKISELVDVTMKADALTKMVKTLAASLRAEKQ